jgi:hypothetical protein
LTGGIFTGLTINGKLLPGPSADWQTALPDGTCGSYFLPPKSPPRFSGSANPGGGVAGKWTGGLGAGGFSGLEAGTNVA